MKVSALTRVSTLLRSYCPLDCIKNATCKSEYQHALVFHPTDPVDSNCSDGAVSYLFVWWKAVQSRYLSIYCSFSIGMDIYRETEPHLFAR